MRNLFLCLLSLILLTTNAQTSRKNNLLESKTAASFLQVQREKRNGASRIVRSEHLSKTINLSEAGSLENLLTPIEKNTITNLTITGKMDARDFRIMRDSMINISALDISAATVVSYSGYGGTDGYYRSYSANEIPDYAFYSSGEQSNAITGLTTILLPSTVTSIGNMAFTFCSSLTSISISSSVTQIGEIAFLGSSAIITVDPANPSFSSVDGVLYDKAKTTLIQCPVSITGSYDVPSTVHSIGIYGFCFCDKLTSINIPSAVETIGIYAFTSCSGMINIDPDNKNYTSQDGVLFNKSASTLIQCGTLKSGSYNIPSSVDSIGNNAFYNCSLLTSLSIPSSVISIADLAFFNCSGLTSITVNSLPVYINSSSNVFFQVNTNTCILYVPFGTKSLYQSASGWRSFSNIVENSHGFVLETNKRVLSSEAGSSAGIKISANNAWTVVSNQNWLKVTPENGTGNDTIVVTADANISTDKRKALVTVSSEGTQPQTITITQAGIPTSINITAGTLSSVIPTAELRTIINLKITGTMDARDFKTLRDNMPMLNYLDISEVTIAEYNGPLGTTTWVSAYPANRIPDYAFNFNQSPQQQSLSTIKLPATINAVGDYAFYSCQALTEIVIPNSVTYIGPGCFGSCTGLTNIVLPNQLTSIESQTFTGCGFSGITIPSSVTSIGQNSFSYCKKLRSIIIPNSVTTLSGSAFESCTSLSDLTIGNSVTYIGNSTFGNCSGLGSVVLPNSVTTLDSYAFGNCTNLKSVILSSSLTTIGYYNFYQCTSLTDIIIPNTVTRIEYSAFSNCSSLTTLNIPGSVTYIGNSAFSDCTGLKSITVESGTPVDLSSSYNVFTGVDIKTCILNVPFGSKSFYQSAGQWKEFVNIAENVHGFILSKNTIKLLSTEGSKSSVVITSNDAWTTSSNQTWLTVSPTTGTGNDTLRITADANLSSLQRTAVITVTSGTLSNKISVTQAASPKILTITAGGLSKALTSDELNSVTDLTIKGTMDARDFRILRDSMPKLENLDISTLKIESYSGSNGTTYYSYTFPANEIPESAFFNSYTYVGKTILNTISLPISATSIGNSAFQYCTGLVRISIPDPVISIGGSAFLKCTGLTELKISNSLKAIAGNTFQYCSGLSTLVIPNSVKSIGDYSFDSCTGLTDLIIPDSVSSLGSFSFANCKMLKNVTIGKSLTSINYGDFQNCTSLSNVVMTNALKTIGDLSFYSTALTHLNLPESVTSIGYSSFNYCADLSEVVLPNSLTLIGSSAFSNCTGLKKVTVGNSLTTISNGAFYSCTALTDIVLPESVTSIESSAFYNCTGLLSITANPLIPVDLSSSSTVFNGIDKTLCKLYVPYQSKTLYATAEQWKDFKNIVENPFGLITDLNAARLSPKAGSSVDVNIISNTDWKAVSNQSWLSVSSVSGSGNKLITITAEENSSATSRTALVTVSAVGLPDKTITITQAAMSRTVQVTAGGLSTILSPTELNTISNLILTGTIDARDFKTMRDMMPLLSDIDLSGTKIIAYSGTAGTAGTYTYDYPAAAIPQYAFYKLYTYTANTSLISVVLPASTVTIGSSAFQNCTGLFSVKLPETLTSISEYAFNRCSGLTDINLPDSLLSIGNYAFSNCSVLRNIRFGNSLNTINNNVFEYCLSLKSVVLPNTVTTLGSNVFQYCKALTDATFGNLISTTGNWTFLYCTALRNVVLSNSITTIGYSSFQSCKNLVNITLGNSLTTISGSAFSTCSMLETVIIPNSVTLVDFRAFEDCTSLKHVTLSNSLTTIGSETFWNCTALNDIVLPNSVTSIGADAFYACSSLTNFKFNTTLKTIESGAFSNCSGLVDVILPNSVTTIGDYAFNGCNALKSITIPAGISTLGYSSISSGSLSSIYSLASVPITPYSSGVFNYVNKSTCILYVPQGSKAAYQTTPQWKDFVNISEDFGFLLENQVIRIKSGGSYTIDFPTTKTFTAVSDQPWLKATIIAGTESYKIELTSDINPDQSLRTALITISFTDGPTKTITVIQSGSPKTVTVSSGNLRNSLTTLELSTVSNLILSGTIDARDFRVMRDSMPQLTDIDLKEATITAYSGPEGTNPSIGEYPANETPINSFYKTYSGIGKETLATIILPANITSIGKSSFAYARGLSSIIIPDHVTVINETAFAYCQGLKDVTIGNSVTTIGVEAFYICTKLSEVSIPNSVTTISKEAFSGCAALKSIIFSSNLTTIGTDAFVFCSSLTNVEIPNSVKTIETGAFRYCYKLARVVLPATLTELKYDVFYYCPLLKEIKLPETLKIIGPEVFAYCTGLSTISIPASVNNIGYNVFSNCTSLSSIYAYPVNPVDLSSISLSSNVFYNVNTSNCTLYVPTNSKALYQAAIQWKDFTNIIEMPTTYTNLINENIKIYPNPVKASFSVTGLNETARIILTDINGKQVINREAGTGEIIPVSGLAKGIYILRVFSTDGTLERKLIKE